MQQVIFLDRDGTLIKEPPDDFQVDSLEKLEFMPGVFRNLYAICTGLNYELVMVSNQDGLGTNTYPQKKYDLVQEKMLTAFKNENIKFDNILIDPSLPEDNSPNRKPKTGLLKDYRNDNYDMVNSYVIGDRLTDIQLARNIGCKGILYNSTISNEEIKKEGLSDIIVLNTDSWDEIYKILAYGDRKSKIERTTGETEIQVELNLDGTGQTEISTGIGFFDHMLGQIAKHGICDLSISVKGDLEVDEHHTIEDTGLALGEAFRKALGDKLNINRYGFVLPMDDSLAQVALDFGGRSWLVWEAEFKREKIGEMPTEMFFHFFKSFADTALCNLHIKAEGQNEHHKIEAIFKAFARSIRMAKNRSRENYGLPTTKGKL